MQRHCYRTRNSFSPEKASYCEEGDTSFEVGSANAENWETTRVPQEAQDYLHKLKSFGPALSRIWVKGCVHGDGIWFSQMLSRRTLQRRLSVCTKTVTSLSCFYGALLSVQPQSWNVKHCTAPSLARRSKHKEAPEDQPHQRRATRPLLPAVPALEDQLASCIGRGATGGGTAPARLSAP